MNNCHGKHDGKFCNGSSDGGGNQIKKAAADRFNDPAQKKNEIVNHTRYPHIPAGQFNVSIQALQKGGPDIEASIKPITMAGGFTSGYEVRGGGMKGALKGSELDNLIETGQYKIKR